MRVLSDRVIAHGRPLRLAAAVAAALAASLAFCRLRLWLCPELYYASYQRILAGTAETPFQHRILVALIGRGLSALLGPVDPTFALDLLAVAAILLIAAWWCRRLGRHPLWAAALYYMMLVNYTGPFGYNMRECYDMPALLFALVATIWLRERRYGAFYALLPVALLNRESFAFLCLLFALTQAPVLPRPVLLRHLAVQLALIILVKGGLVLAYRHSPGPGALSLFEGPGAGWENMRLHANLRRLVKLQFMPVFGGLWIPLLVLRRRLADGFARRALWLVPPVLALMMLVGNLTEFRIFTELLPVVFQGVVLAFGRPAGAARPA